MGKKSKSSTSNNAQSSTSGFRVLDEDSDNDIPKKITESVDISNIREKIAGREDYFLCMLSENHGTSLNLENRQIIVSSEVQSLLNSCVSEIKKICANPKMLESYNIPKRSSSKKATKNESNFINDEKRVDVRVFSKKIKDYEDIFLNDLKEQYGVSLRWEGSSHIVASSDIPSLLEAFINEMEVMKADPDKALMNLPKLQRAKIERLIPPEYLLDDSLSMAMVNSSERSGSGITGVNESTIDYTGIDAATNAYSDYEVGQQDFDIDDGQFSSTVDTRFLLERIFGYEYDFIERMEKDHGVSLRWTGNSDYTKLIVSSVEPAMLDAFVTFLVELKENMIIFDNFVRNFPNAGKSVNLHLNDSNTSQVSPNNSSSSSSSSMSISKVTPIITSSNEATAATTTPTVVGSKSYTPYFPVPGSPTNLSGLPIPPSMRTVGDVTDRPSPTNSSSTQAPIGPPKPPVSTAYTHTASYTKPPPSSLMFGSGDSSHIENNSLSSSSLPSSPFFNTVYDPWGGALTSSAALQMPWEANPGPSGSSHFSSSMIDTSMYSPFMPSSVVPQKEMLPNSSVSAAMAGSAVQSHSFSSDMSSGVSSAMTTSYDVFENQSNSDYLLGTSKHVGVIGIEEQQPQQRQPGVTGFLYKDVVEKVRASEEDVRSPTTALEEPIDVPANLKDVIKGYEKQFLNKLTAMYGVSLKWLDWHYRIIIASSLERTLLSQAATEIKDICSNYNVVRFIMAGPNHLAGEVDIFEYQNLLLDNNESVLGWLAREYKIEYQIRRPASDRCILMARTSTDSDILRLFMERVRDPLILRNDLENEKKKKIHIFVDISNIAIGARTTAPIDVSRLIDLVSDQRDVLELVAVGSGNERDRNWDTWRAIFGDGLHILKRVRKEDRAQEQAVDDMLHALILKTAAKNFGVKSHTIVLLSGDGNSNYNRTSFPEVCETAIKNNFVVEVWSWQQSTSSVYNRFHDHYAERFVIKPLDPHLDCLTSADVSGKPIPSRSIHIFVDIYTIVAEAQRITKIPDIRIIAQKLLEIIEENRNVSSRIAVGFGSYDSLFWQSYRKLGFDTIVVDRIKNSSEEIANQMLDETIGAQIAVLIDSKPMRLNASPGTLVLVTRDNFSFPEMIEHALEKGWSVEVWSWFTMPEKTAYQTFPSGKYGGSFLHRSLETYVNELTYRIEKGGPRTSHNSNNNRSSKYNSK